MRRRYKLLLLLLLCVVIGAAAVVYSPSLLVRPVLSYYLNAAGFELSELSEIKIGRQQTTVKRLTLSNAQLRFSAHASELHYTPSELLSGRLQSLSIERLQVELLSNEQSVPEQTITTTENISSRVSRALQAFNTLPLSNLRVHAIEVQSADSRIDLQLQIDTQPLQIVGSAESNEYPGIRLAVLAASNSDSDDISANLDLTIDNQNALTSKLLASAINDDLRLQFNAELSLATLKNRADTENWLPLFSLIGDKLSLQSDFTLSNFLQSPGIAGFSVLIDNPEHALGFSFQQAPTQGPADPSQYAQALTIGLPLQLKGTMANLDAPVELQSDSVQLSLSHNAGINSLHSELQLDALSLSCNLRLACAFASEFQSLVQNLHTESLSASMLQLNGSLLLGSNENGMSFSVPRLQIDSSEGILTIADASLRLEGAVNTLTIFCTPDYDCDGDGALAVRISELRAQVFSSENIAMNGALQFKLGSDGFSLSIPSLLADVTNAVAMEKQVSFSAQIADMQLDIGEKIRSSFSLSSENFLPEFDGFTVRNPALNASIRYENDELQGTFDVQLANQLRTTAQLRYALLSQTGELNWELPAYSFSKITPLSALVNQSRFNADLVAGSVKGSGSLRVTRDNNGEWLVVGPLSFTLNELGGFFDDSFFVGFNSALEAEISDAGRIRTTETLSARISTLDVGLPLSDISWNYRFDSEDDQVTIEQLNLHTLGGEISMPQFNYRASNPSTVLTVVLANLDLKAIVALAQYPGLAVSGLVSGFLPLRLTGNKLSIEEGLVGALLPGGSIRYASGNPIASTNASLALVNRALANYQYQLMNTKVFYNDNGDLHLDVQLLGNNPDVYDGQQINLNVSIDDNIPTLLRSLQASRTISDALEQRLQFRSRTVPR